MTDLTSAVPFPQHTASIFFTTQLITIYFHFDTVGWASGRASGL